MRKNIKINELRSLIALLDLFKYVGLLEQKDFIVMWERRPVSNISKFNSYDLEDTYGVCGCKIQLWDPCGAGLANATRFVIEEEE